MAKKKEEAEYSQLSVDDLRRRLIETREELFKVRFQNSSAPLKNPLKIRSLRREVARLSTFIHQKGSSQ